MTENGTGGNLAAALAKAQVAFAPVKRDKKVVVKTKTGGSYEFSYAPLDSILDAVRKPLSDNGLVVVQLLDAGDLVTMLLHDSGERLSGSVALPQGTDIQGLGSAITYLRRYALQALLGIAAEDDDDGNQAVGNIATPAGKAKAQPAATNGGLIGTLVAQGTQDFALRQTPDGWVLPFRVKEGSKSQIVIAHDQMAQALDFVREDALGARVTVFGTYTDEVLKKGTGDYSYQVLHLTRIVGPTFTIPAPEAETVPLFSDEEAAEIAARELAEAASA